MHAHIRTYIFTKCKKKNRERWNCMIVYLHMLACYLWGYWAKQIFLDTIHNRINAWAVPN